MKLTDAAAELAQQAAKRLESNSVELAGDVIPVPYPLNEHELGGPTAGRYPDPPPGGAQIVAFPRKGVARG